MIVSKTGNHVGKTGSTVEIGKGEIDNAIKQDIQDIRQEFKGGEIVTCPYCSERYKIKPDEKLNRVERIKLLVHQAGILAREFLTMGHCPYCNKGGHFHQDKKENFEVNNETITALKLAVWK
jgi:DNA-directed RNA polymerase subunit RPC12/RpoP